MVGWLVRLGLATVAIGLAAAELSAEEYDAQQKQKTQQARAALQRDYCPSRLDQLKEDMSVCAAHVFESPELSSDNFFSEFFGQRWVHMLDNGQRARRCAAVFQGALVRPLLEAATQEYIGKHVNILAPSATTAQKCRTRSQCKAAFDRGDSTIVIGAVEQVCKQ